MDLFMALEIYDFEHFVDTRVDVVYLSSPCRSLGEGGLRKTLLEKFADREVHLRTRDDLPRRCNTDTRRYIDSTRLRRLFANDEFEYRTLARTVLPHERNLRTLTHGKIHLIEDGLLCAEFVRHVFEADYRFIARHKDTPYPIGAGSESSNVLEKLNPDNSKYFSDAERNRHGERSARNNSYSCDGSIRASGLRAQGTGDR